MLNLTYNYTNYNVIRVSWEGLVTDVDCADFFEVKCRCSHLDVLNNHCRTGRHESFSSWSRIISPHYDDLPSEWLESFNAKYEYKVINLKGGAKQIGNFLRF